MRRLILFAAALSIAGCATVPTSPAGTTRDDAILAVASSAATVADAIGQAPPATLTRTKIDEKAIRIAFKTFDGVRIVLDQLIANGTLVRNSPQSLAVRRAFLIALDAINAASAAQRAGQAATYTEALNRAQTALAGVRAALAR